MLIYKTIALIVFYFGFPILIIYGTHKISFLNKIGSVVLAYIFGLIVGNIGVFPKAGTELKMMLKGKASLPHSDANLLFERGVITSTDLIANQIASIQNTLISVVILLAIPLLLFSLDIRKWIRIANEAVISLLLAMTSLVLAIFIGYFIFKNLIDEPWKISGMLVGLYTGGTPNLAAISTALEVNATTFLLTHTYDMVVGAICLVFLMTVAQRLFNLFLPSFKNKHARLANELDLDQAREIDNFVIILTKYGLIDLMKAFGISSIVVAIGGGLSMLVPAHSQMVTVVLSITTLGLLLSNWHVVNKLENSFQLGMYFIIVFSLIVASMGNLSEMLHITSLHLFSFVALVVLGSMSIHACLAFLFRIDSDTTIITMTALTYSPPFVPVVAGALKNKNIIISGLTVGILGYAIGNYLGFAIAYFLE
jgi:uncharacterized membrane protein